jgi:hypothetical protein
MTAPTPAAYTPKPQRRIACARCGTDFDCGGLACWCAAESYRLPMPTDSTATCLCPACLREKAAGE